MEGVSKGGVTRGGGPYCLEAEVPIQAFASPAQTDVVLVLVHGVCVFLGFLGFSSDPGVAVRSLLGH